MKKFLFALLFVSIQCFAAQQITAKSYQISDEDGVVIVEKNSSDVRPIASITKLMTVMVVLDGGQSLQEPLSIDFRNNRLYHSKIPRSVKTLTRGELIDLALVKSDNLAAYTLCANYYYGIDRCIAEMNHKAFTLGMTNTHFDDPTGLYNTNVSTAQDLTKLVIAAELYDEIVAASQKQQVDIKVKKRWWHFGNTNPLVGREQITVSKTGFINESGGCVVMKIGNRVIVLLGSRNTRTRFPEAKKLLII